MESACELVLTGGLMNALETFVAPLKQTVMRRLPACKIQYPELPPEFGACLLGLKYFEIPLTKSIIDELHFDAGHTAKDE